jgi:hypothetical protein
MLFSLLKVNISKNRFKLDRPFVVKSKFLDLEFKKSLTYKDFTVGYCSLVSSHIDYKSVIRGWYLLLALRNIRLPLVSGKTPIFSYRRTKLFPKHQDSYNLVIYKQFYETLIEHRRVFYFSPIVTSSIDRLYLIFCLYTLKTKIPDGGEVTVVNKRVTYSDRRKKLINFFLKRKWKLRVLSFR